MYGHPRFQPGGGGRGPRQPVLPPPQALYADYTQSPNFFYQNPTFLNPFQQFPPQDHPSFPVQNPSFPIQNNLNFPIHTQNFPRPQFPNPQRTTPNESIERIEQAVTKARHDLLAAGENVSSWKVSQAALLAQQVDSWETLGIRMQQVPSLQRLMVTEGKINAFIHCHVGVQRITSLYDLEMAICSSEGIEHFEELELGPLARHPLARHYFSVNSEVTEVYRITTGEIICYLLEFMDTRNVKSINADNFLDFIAKQRSVTDREKLHVRIHGLGSLLLTYIKQARKLKRGTLKKYLNPSSDKKGKKRALYSSQKKELDDRYKDISRRIKSFSSVDEDFCGKHIRFISSSSEDDESGGTEDKYDSVEKVSQSECKSSLQSTNTGERLSSCPYPSASEEMSRLGLKGENDWQAPASSSLRCNDSNEHSGRKRKSDNSFCTPQKLPKRDRTDLPLCLNDNEVLDCNNLKENDLSFSSDSLKKFITMWKETCQEHNVAEVLERMVQFYENTARRRKRITSVLSSHPCIGLLNVAVTSMKCGMWDSMYDTFQAFSLQGIGNISSEKCSEYESIEVEPSEKNLSATTEYVPKCKNNVTVEDIIEKVNTFFEVDEDSLNNIRSLGEKKFSVLRKLIDCKLWLAKELSVKEFESLGHGEFLMFLEKHASRLPNGIKRCLTDYTCENSPLEVCMLHYQLVVLLSQASNSLWENEDITKEKISKLLTRQFPSTSFRIKESSSMTDFLGSLQRNDVTGTSNCVIFSATLLGMSCNGELLACDEKSLLKTALPGAEIGHKAGILGLVTTKDAVEVLLRAPMLSDIGLWSHWDIIYAPSLGSLVDWLLNEVNRKDLLCLVTKDGKVLRIDHSATLDSFLESFLHRSSFQTAVHLLSLFSLYGGARHLPLSLLKSHARRAFEVIVENFDEMEINVGETISNRGSSLSREQLLDEDPSHKFSSELHKCRSITNKAVSVAARFFLDCLAFIPIEFRTFAADILVSGLRSVNKAAPLAILSECKQTEHRLMIHELGLSLGIVEWIDDYHVFRSSPATNSSEELSCLKTIKSELQIASCSSKSDLVVSVVADEKFTGVPKKIKTVDVSRDRASDVYMQEISELDKYNEASLVIESIRREEFGLDPSISDAERSMLKKQHARLGRALHCLSQELYSQDSHFLLELVQNADDNIYSDNVEPTLTFILQEVGIVVLNNEQGFSPQNIRALCDVGNSTKKGCGSGYIGKKGIGFKSVFRVTDAPEIHSNGFHVKFDISEGQIGFVLPSIVPPCDIDFLGKLASTDTAPRDTGCWKTCIVLPFRSKLSEGSVISSIISMFSDLHPSLLLFLHRLQCIKFRNMLDDSLIVMRKEIVGDGITRVSLGNEKMTWYVASQQLRANIIRPDVQTTEISIAFTLQESDNGDYVPLLCQQPVFAFLPLRTYGLKCILQGDFVLPSSREEVDGDSPWNQWLLSQFPDLFVCAQRSFCALSCFRENPGRAVAAFMSFVPLVGEVHGFFSSLPRMIISKLRMSNCLLLEGNNCEWVPPCKVLRNWNEQARTLLPDSLLQLHLGLGFLDKDIILSDSLARALGVEEYGPKILVQLMSSLCLKENNIEALGLVWLSSWLNTLYTMLSHSSAQISHRSGIESDLINSLRKIPFVPLSDGTYASVDEGTIWLQFAGFDNENGPEAFPRLYAKLRIVSAGLFAAAVDISCPDGSDVENITRMLQLIGIQPLSAHEIVKVHILPAISDDRISSNDKSLMIEYLSFVMLHLQSSCSNCPAERDFIISDLFDKALILTNNGFKRPVEVSMHFSREFGNPIDVSKLIDGIGLEWLEVDICYLQHPITKSLSNGVVKWRKFFQELGVTDFVHVSLIEKNVADMHPSVLKHVILDSDLVSLGSTVKDWESQELVQLISKLSSSGDQIRSKYLLEVLDTLWDDYLFDKVSGYCNLGTTGDSIPFKSSFLSSLCDVRWIRSSVDNELHYPKDLFCDSDSVRAILGATAPYAVPKVRSEKFCRDIGFKTVVNLDDILAVLQVWRSETHFQASIAQMSKFYNFIWNEVAASKNKIMAALDTGPFIFVPYLSGSRHEDVVPGLFLPPLEVYWHDPTGSMDQMKETHPHSGLNVTDRPLSKTLCNIYPGLHDFFVSLCGVNKNPPFRGYLHILQQLAAITLPSQAANKVFQVFTKWADGLKSGLLSPEDIVYVKECLMKVEYAVLSTVQDKWVSLHPSFGLVCWCDDESLRKEFKHSDDIDFLYFGKLSEDDKEILQARISVLMKALGIPILSDVVAREAIYYGPTDSSFKAALVNWALPYAQRYIFNLHPDLYTQLKQSGVEKICHLRVVVVEKLFYKNVVKGSGVASKKRFECSCLLEGNLLYCTQESDSHSIYMELSRLLFDGTAELHLANFLHMITTMAESGSTEEQTEFFILNSQKLPKLPDKDSVWSLSPTDNYETLQSNCASTMTNKPTPPKFKRKPGISVNWPPADWKTAPGFGFARACGVQTQPPPPIQVTAEDDFEVAVLETDNIVQISADPTIGDDLAAKTMTVEVCVEDSVTSVDVSHLEHNLVSSSMNVMFDPGAVVTPSEGSSASSSKSIQRNQLFFGNPNPQEAALTGRLGELVAFNYFAANAGNKVVKWVNQDNETGLPYDIVLGDIDNSLEFIEVKATKSARKDWFAITVREWQFAVEKGELFSIAHVSLGANNMARITVFKNPVRLCQLGKLQLSVIMPKQPKDSSTAS